MTYQLTDEKLFRRFWDYTVNGDLKGQVLYTPDGMRTAYDQGRDHQLEQVMNWLDKHLASYLDPDYLNSCESIPDLEDDLKKAMRPQEDN